MQEDLINPNTAQQLGSVSKKKKQTKKTFHILHKVKIGTIFIGEFFTVDNDNTSHVCHLLLA